VSTELKLRIVSAVVLGVLVLWVTWVGGRTFSLLWAVAAILVMMEFSRISSAVMPIMPKFAAFAGLILSICAWIGGEQQIAFMIFIIGFVVLAGWEYLLRQSIWAATGLIYAGLPFFAISELRGTGNEGLLIVVLLFACVWGADIFAYIAGRSIGGPKLAPRISPKKTWAGFIGSLTGAIILTWAVVAYAGYSVGFAFFVIMITLAVISQIGDLVESSFKRKFDVKDSGKIIPGHGGVLDRIDGLIFAGVLFWLILLLLRYSYLTDLPIQSVFTRAFLLT